MKTKSQKLKELEESKRLLDNSKNLVFIDFTKTSAEDLRLLRRKVREAGFVLKVMKKRLFNVALKEKNIDFDATVFGSQLGTFFVPDDINGISGIVYNFSKGKEGFKILGGYDLAAKAVVGADMVIRLGQLPSREILLSQLIGMIASPLRTLLYVLAERGKKVAT